MSDEVNKVPVYAEPEGIDYIIIKVKESAIDEHSGSLYETTRKAWRAKLESAMPYKYVLSVVGGIVQEVYSVLRWYTSPNYAPRIEFEGEVAEFKIRSLFVGKMIPECYRQKGLASPFLYKKKAGAPVDDAAVEDLVVQQADAAEAKAKAGTEAKDKAENENTKSNRFYVTFDFEPDVSTMRQINVLPYIDKECAQIAEDNQESLANMVSQLWKKEWERKKVNGVESAAVFRFAYSCAEVELYVSDHKCNTIYEDEFFLLAPNYEAMSVEEYADNYAEDEGEEGVEKYKAYLVNSIKDIKAENPRDRSIVRAMEGLIDNSVSEETFVPTMIKHTIENANAEKAVLHGQDGISMSSVTFYVDLPQGENFDPKKLDFISFDEDYAEKAVVLNKIIGDGHFVSLDAILYDGKMYFCKEEDIDDMLYIGINNYYQTIKSKDLIDE